MMVSDAYIAGFVDGEGTIDIRHRQTHGGKYHRYEARLSIGQKVSTPLIAIKEKYGGSINTSNGMFRYILVGDNLLAALQNMLPYMIVKKDEASVAIQFMLYCKTIGRKHKKVGKGFEKHSNEIYETKNAFMDDVRQLRQDKGLKSRVKAQNYAVS